MIQGKKVVVVMPAYNAEKTLKATLEEVPSEIVDEIVLVDDNSNDKTIRKAEELGIKHIVKHDKNRGYGGNQKSCYRKALDLDADIVVMLHPDYQYTPKLMLSMTSLIANGLYEMVMGSRILGKGAVRGGMPMYKYISNRVLTFLQNLIMSQKLSEYHTGYRAYSASLLRKINFEANSDDFVFDNQLIAQVFMTGAEIAEITCPTKYFPEASSINFVRSTKYGFGCLWTALEYRLNRWGIFHSTKFKAYRG